jgi:hypothetical protein
LKSCRAFRNWKSDLKQALMGWLQNGIIRGGKCSKGEIADSEKDSTSVILYNFFFSTGV